MEEVGAEMEEEEEAAVEVVEEEVAGMVATNNWLELVQLSSRMGRRPSMEWTLRMYNDVLRRRKCASLQMIGPRCKNCEGRNEQLRPFMEVPRPHVKS